MDKIITEPWKNCSRQEAGSEQRKKSLIVTERIRRSVNYSRLPLYIEAAMRVISSGVSAIPWENQRSRQE